MVKEYKQMKNIVTVQGRLMTNNLQIKTNAAGKRYISGTLDIRTENDYIVPVNFFSNELKKDNTINKLFTGIDKTREFPAADTVGERAAAVVTISSAEIEDNSFYSEQESAILANWRIGGKFVRTATADAAPHSEFMIEGVISSIKEVVDREGEVTGDYEIKLYNVGFGNRINEIAFRINTPEAIAFITNNYELGDLIMLSGKIVYEQNTITKVTEVAFGEPREQTFTNTTRMLLVTAGSAPIREEEHDYKLKDMRELISARNNDIKERFAARNAIVNTTKQSSGNSFLF